MGETLSGLSGGWDWKPFVDKLVENSRIPQNRLRKDKTNIASKTTALNEINTSISSLKQSVESLGTSLTKKTATFASTTTTWTASAGANTPPGDYKFSVNQQATASTLSGAPSLSGFPSAGILSSLPLRPSISAGTFSVNGSPITISSTASDLTTVLQDIKNKLGSGGDALINPEGKLVLTSSSPIVIGASGDTSNFLLAMGLSNPSTQPAYTISSPQGLASLNLSNPLNSAGFATSPASNGSFKINGVLISYTSSSTISSVLSDINNSSAGVSAAYDSASKKFILTNKNTGDLAVTVSDESGNLAQVMGLASGQLSIGKNAAFTINDGGTIFSRSNKLDQSVHGIPDLTVTLNSSSNLQTITVAGDSSAAKTAINDFISKYNSVQSTIEKHTKVTTSNGKTTSSILSGNTAVAQISNNLRSLISQQGAAVPGTIQRLADIGVGTSGLEATLSLNTSTFDAKFSSSYADVNSFLNTTGSGLIARFNSIVGDSGSAKTSIKTQTDAFAKQTTSIDKQVDDWEDRITQIRKSLEARYVAMDVANAKYQNQMATLNQNLKKMGFL
jgi:flagellar hook-associated protein 2